MATQDHRRVLDLRYVDFGNGRFELADVVMDGRSLIAIAEGRAASLEEWEAENQADENAVLGREVADLVRIEGKRSDRGFVLEVLEYVAVHQGTVEISKAKGSKYVNLFPPRKTHRHKRIGGIMVTPNSSRFGVTGLGAVDISDFDIAEEVFENGVYEYPKIAALDSREAVEEAKRLIDMAWEALER